MTFKQWKEYLRVYWQQYYVQWQVRRKAEHAKQKSHKGHRVVHPLTVQVVKPVLWRTATGSLKKRAHLLDGLAHALAAEQKKPKQYAT